MYGTDVTEVRFWVDYRIRFPGDFALPGDVLPRKDGTPGTVYKVMRVGDAEYILTIPQEVVTPEMESRFLRGDL